MERKKNKPIVNNTFYDTLHEQWYEGQNHPIALLRAENATRNPWILETIAEHVGMNKKVLDLGCGGGLLSNTLALAGHEVTGIDLSMNSLREAQVRDTTQSVTYLCRAAEDLPFENNSFDIVAAMDLLEHVDDPKTVIQEVGRVLKPNGLFFFHTFNRNFLSYLMVIKGIDWCVPNAPKDMHLYSHFITPRELTQQCKEVNLTVEKMLGLHPDLFHSSFWKCFLLKKIAKDFRFVFSNSLATGYVGFAKKTGQNIGP
ncbi:MAG: bifunctional 2-polyprenyl-6-hydroxyphenol methylase/3-demethylubiquinol 3-O-methyltransferase UbiG [Rhabdochlamydiaceae bacterium]|nr:bifunctional 2-polyprenyl-6-hydroxyphenol methylase/3-demethylubiquinol 3-O-methyltransferase UbiG [Rhabdochlamydiaceae bacterium]